MAIPANLLDGVKRLDPLPATLQQLVGALNDDHVGPAQIGQIVQFDPAVVSGVLRLANSGAYGGWSRTDSVRDAVTRLGKTRVINIVLGKHMKKINVAAPFYDLSQDELWAHGAAASVAVRAIAPECPKAGLGESAAIAGLVHDVGKLIMVRYLKADVGAILALRKDRGITFVEAERELFGCDHAEVGGEVARHWGFPAEIREAIARHHEVPLEDSTPLLDAVVVANVVAKTIETGLGAEGMDVRIDGRCRERLRLGFARFSRVCLATMSGLQELKGVYGAKTA